MISITKLLFGDEYDGDALRYHPGASGARDGTGEGKGPVVVWNMTRTCNLRCRHCYMDADSERHGGELTTEEARDFIYDLSTFRSPALLFSGGEPLMRDDFFELAEYASELGVRPTLSTNGTLITKKIARRIKEAGVTYVGISLDGIGPVNDAFRGTDGAYEAAMRGIRHCTEVGQRVGLRFTINQNNVGSLDDIFDFIEREDVGRACFYHLVYSGRGALLADEDVSPGEMRSAMDTIVRRARDFEARGIKKEILTVDNHCDGIYLWLKAMEEGDAARAERIHSLISMNGGNRSGIAFGEVDPEGYVHADQFTRQHTFGNVRMTRFSRIWSEAAHPILAGLKERKPLLKGRCKMCRFLSLCNGNFRARAEAKTGDFWESDPACYLTDEEIGIG